MAPPIRLIQTALGPFVCYDDTVGQALAKGEFWDQQIQPYLDEAPTHGWALDLGANIGWFTVYLAQRGFTRVFAVEAHPVTFRVLKQNVTNAGVGDRVTLLQVAAYDHHLLMHLAAPEQIGWPIPDPATLEGCPHPASIAFVPRTSDGLAGFLTRGAPLDYVIPPDAPITLIKVDVQGCDLRALVGLRRTITRCRPLIIFEYEQGASLWHGDTWDDYLHFFTELHYTVTRIREDLWDFVARPEGVSGIKC